ncbi:hypothetical protein [Rhizobium leguminosarum]|nr:hypothetical protein [Rhizobium leguminosarum]
MIGPSGPYALNRKTQPPHDLKRDIAQPRRILGLARPTPQTLCVEILS